MTTGVMCSLPFHKVCKRNNNNVNNAFDTYLLTPWIQNPSWEANRFSSSQIFPHCMEREGSLPHSQVPATCPYSEPARSSPYPYIPLPEGPFQYYPPIYACVLQAVSFPQVSRPKPCIRLSPYMQHVLPVSFSIWSPEQSLARSNDH